MSKIVGIDAHMHGDILIKKDKRFPSKYYSHNIGGIIWAYNEQIIYCEDYVKYWKELKEITYNISHEGSPFFYKVGIHPRTICNELKEKKYLPDQLKKGLETLIKDKKCLGIGEIGLDGLDSTQELIFIEQLNWCKEFLPENKKIGIHTPRKNKQQITKIILDILKDFNELHDRIIIDHVEINTIHLIKELNFQIGITLQKGKSTPQDIQKLIQENLYDLNKICLNSDGGEKISDPYFEFIEKDYVTCKIKSKLIKHNIESFYCLTN